MLSLVAARLRQRVGVDSLSDFKTVSSDDWAKRHFGQRGAAFDFSEEGKKRF
jgi:hypothetical protein